MSGPSGSGMDKFHDRLVSNIKEDFFDVIAVTSRSAGKIPSEGRPYRVGKSTFAMWLSALAHYWWHKYYHHEVDIKQMWNEVFDHLFYDLYDVEQYIRSLAKQGKTIPAIVWDEAERSAPAYQHIPNKMRKAIYNINTYGTAVKFLIVTCPAISDLVKPLRKMVTIEVIIPQRGKFEVQFVRLRKKFRKAPEEFSYYEYWGEGTFPPLPKDIQKRYDEWRRQLPATQVKGYDNDDGDSGKEGDGIGDKYPLLKKFGKFDSDILDKLYTCGEIESEEGYIGKLSWWKNCFPDFLKKWVPVHLINSYIFDTLGGRASRNFSSYVASKCAEGEIVCRKIGRYLYVEPKSFTKCLIEYIVVSETTRSVLPDNVRVIVKRRRRRNI